MYINSIVIVADAFWDAENVVCVIQAHLVKQNSA